MNSLTYSSAIPFFAIDNTTISVKRSNFTLVFLTAACYADPHTVRKEAGSSSYISRKIFRKFSNTSANKNLSL